MSESEDNAVAPAKPKCGLIIPISAIAGCTEQHWSDVKTILTEALQEIGYTADLVSEADDVGVIQKRIIHNVYENPIVVCDVSGKNPNVMFELGMRLAFDKPTVIVKDDQTEYSFDTSPIEHIEYPRDLRFNKIVEFKQKLKDKVKGTYEASQKPNYTTFLKNFGEFKVAKLDTQEVDKEEYLLSEVKDLKRLVVRALRFGSTVTKGELHGPHLLGAEECSTIIREAIEAAVHNLAKGGGRIDHPSMSSTVLQHVGSTGGRLPNCFQADRDVCRHKFKQVLERVIENN